MSRGGLPGPIRRLARQPTRTGAILLLAAAALAAAGIQGGAAAALQATLDEQWRGAYDILVTPSDVVGPIDGALAPNTLASSDPGMSLEDLAEVRGIDGIAVAAPIGEVMIPGLKSGQVAVAVPRAALGAAETPQAYRVTATYSTDDGLGERVVWSDTVRIVVDETFGDVPPSRSPGCGDDPDATMGYNEFEFLPGDYPALTDSICIFGDRGDRVVVLNADGSQGWSSPEGAEPLTFTLPQTPLGATRLTLVDPIAEKALLGRSGGFLDPLIAVGEVGGSDVAAMREWAAEAGGPFAERFLAEQSSITPDPMPAAVLHDLRRLYAANGADFDAELAAMTTGIAAAPFLISETPPAPLTLKIGVESFGDAPTNDEQPGFRGYTLPAALTAGDPGEHIGVSATDTSAILNPFSNEPANIVWPGAELAIADGLRTWSSLGMQHVGKTGAAAITDGVEGPTMQPSGYRSPLMDWDDMFALDADPSDVGVESAYAPLAPFQDLTGVGETVIAVPVGSFDSAAIAVSDDAANYVPLGAYDPVGSVVADGPHAGTALNPSVSGLGLISSRTSAVGSIESAAVWGDTHPISAIRVRVAGIEAYSPEAQERVVDVARAIEALGFTASIVAGSSPADIDVTVDGYAFGTIDPSGEQTVGELGTVTQRWSELGAAARVELAVSTATMAILGIALATGIVLLAAVQVAGVPGRREQSLVMREVGFTRKRIARWFALEELPGIVVVLLVGAAAVRLSHATGIATITAILAVVAVLASSIAAVVAGSRVTGLRTPRDARSRRIGARSVAGFGVRQAVVHPLTTVTHVLAIVIVGLAVAGLIHVLRAGQTAAGESSLALLTLGRQLLPQAMLGIVGVVGGILLARLTRRLDLARRHEQWMTLRAAGWTSAQLATAQLAEGVAVAVPAIVLSGTVAFFGAAALDVAPAWLSGVVAVLAAALTAFISFSVRRKGTA